MAVSEPKTPSSRRTMVLPDPVRSALMQHRLDQRELRMKAGRRWKDNNLVFCTANGCLINAWVDRDNWHRLLKRAGVRKARLHDARHTAATLMMMQKIDTRVVMSLMGWTEFKTTQRYTHVVDELQRDAAVQMGKILFDDGEST